MRAKDLADLAGTTVRTIRYYHQLGLLAVPESETTWRSYGFTHLTRLMRIRWLVQSGIPLAEVPHMLRPPGSADERSIVIEDLDAVLTSIDERIAILAAQRARVDELLARVSTQGRLSPLPAPIGETVCRVAQRPLPRALVDAMARERDLLELACYRAPLPDDVVRLVDGVSTEDLDEVCGMWEECHRINEATTGSGLTPEVRAQLAGRGPADRRVAARVDGRATRRLLVRAAELDRPAVRAAVDLAYPSPVYREFVRAFAMVAREGDS